ncbi:MAG: dihydrodipicolinate synthase family protein [Rubrobacteraceae bacterium]|nr:dihydrodipicolinate synthase family protein [Rubrobacteraceae bacterium]MDQ5810190.1 dihydrodipicolinate synthase family protein [Actinomycetota bacterium]
MADELRGCYPILATPFAPDGEIDGESITRLVRHLREAGLPGFTMFGLASEFYKLGDDDREILIERAFEARAPDQRTIVSVTAHSWEVAVRQARRAEEAGAGALMLLPPFFLGPSVADLRRHVLEVAGAVSLPVMVQYAPAQTGVAVGADFFLQLNREAPNVRYVKVEGAPPGPMISAITDGSDGAMGCLVGYGGLQLLDALSRGAVGVQPASGVADYYPRILRAFDEGDLDEAYALHGDLLPLINLLMQGIEPLNKLEKIILKRRGIIASDYCRAVSYEPDEHILAELDRFVGRIADRLHPSAPWPLERSARPGVR